jgi:hypothetical protein
MKAGTALAMLAAAGAFVVAAGNAQPASAAESAAYGHCRRWHDSNTFGASCTGGGRAAYQAVAVCKNGQAVGGPYEGGESGIWSYAYCTRIHSSLDHGYVNWFL